MDWIGGRMNIFFLDKSPRASAQAHYDKHVWKMTIEVCQCISYALNEMEIQLNCECPKHQGNPRPAKWILESYANMRYAIDLGYCLLQEGDERYGKSGKNGIKLANQRMFLAFAMLKVTDIKKWYEKTNKSINKLTTPSQSFNEKLYPNNERFYEWSNSGDSVKKVMENYRAYYNFGDGKKHLTYKKTSPPKWYIQNKE